MFSHSQSEHGRPRPSSLILFSLGLNPPCRDPKSVRADELIHQLESDPEYIARQREWERCSAQSVRECASGIRPSLVTQLALLGLALDSVQEYVAAGGRAHCRSADLLLHTSDQLGTIHVSGRLLFGAASPFRHPHDAACRGLCELYVAEKDQIARWLLANAIGSMAKYPRSSAASPD